MFVPLAHSLPSPLCPVSMGFRTTIIISATSLLLGASCPAQGFDWRTGSLTLLVRTSRSAAVFRPTSQLSSGSSCQSLTCYREHVHPLDRSGLVVSLEISASKLMLASPPILLARALLLPADPHFPRFPPVAFAFHQPITTPSGVPQLLQPPSPRPSTTTRPSSRLLRSSLGRGASLERSPSDASLGSSGRGGVPVEGKSCLMGEASVSSSRRVTLEGEGGRGRTRTCSGLRAGAERRSRSFWVLILPPSP